MRTAPSDRSKKAFPVVKPFVGAPIKTVLGRPRNETATTSPDDVVPPPIRTATGAFGLSISVVPGDAPDVSEPMALPDPPSYTELLGLTEILPGVLGIVQDHVGIHQSYTATDGDTIYARSLIRIRW